MVRDVVFKSDVKRGGSPHFSYPREFSGPVDFRKTAHFSIRNGNLDFSKHQILPFELNEKDSENIEHS